MGRTSGTGGAKGEGELPLCSRVMGVSGLSFVLLLVASVMVLPESDITVSTKGTPGEVLPRLPLPFLLFFPLLLRLSVILGWLVGGVGDGVDMVMQVCKYINRLR